MRLSAILLALPLLAAADQQKPLLQTVQDKFQDFQKDPQSFLTDLYEQGKTFIPGSVTNPVDTAASKVAAKNVVPLTKYNWVETLQSGPSTAGAGIENWMVLVSGGNKTCYGRCGKVEQAWNETAAVFAATTSSAPKLGYIDCDNEAVLCATWAAGPPAIWYIQLPHPAGDQSTPATTIHIVTLNHTTVTAQEIIEIHTEKNYEKVPAYEGAFHPFDGYLAMLGINMALGWVITAFALIPSWAFMIGISFLSRSVM